MSAPIKKSLVDYSRIANRPVADRSTAAASTSQPSHPVDGNSSSRMSSNMQAVMRLMTGKEERTIAEKMADANRPSWEQYKKDNKDMLNLDGLDQQKMEEYRRELDAERDKILSRGLNHGAKKRKKKRRRQKHDSSSGSNASDHEDDSRHRRKRKKDKKRQRNHKHASGSSSDDDDSRRKRKKARKKKRESGDESDGSHYRLSNFFTANDND